MSKIAQPFLTLFLLATAGGCVAHSSAISAIDIPNANVTNIPSQQAGCGWVTVVENTNTRIFALTISNEHRLYEDALFYCCPGKSSPDPVCYEAGWKHFK